MTSPITNLSLESFVPPQIKICGIVNVEDAQLAVKYKADYMGLIFVKSSPRYIDPIIAKHIVETIGKNIKIVGVFQNSTLEEIENIASLVNLDYFQLHGQESPSFCSSLSKPAIKAFQLTSQTTNDEVCITLPLLDLHNGINLPNPQLSFMPKTAKLKAKTATQDEVTKNCLSLLETYRTHCHAFLFDKAKKHDSAGWLASACQALGLIEKNLPFYFFAGNLNIKNIDKVLETLKPNALDIASGLEKTERRKSESLIEEFFEKVRKTKNESATLTV